MLVVGYTTIVISFLFVYFGMRSYRDNVLGGTMTFGKGFNAGILITLISCVCYVAAWLVIYYSFMPDFGERYGAYLLADLQAKGASQAEVDALVKSSADMRRDAREPAHQRRADVHRAVSGRPADHADLSRGIQTTESFVR